MKKFHMNGRQNHGLQMQKNILTLILSGRKIKKIGINDDTDGAHWLYYTPSAIHIHCICFFIYKNKMLTKVKNKKK